ncbi:MAG: chemotaxis protein CheW [Termitinemataceae bacterium]|nr:MAG: chemotaxis protein CheW [Termitinemataceae bacterium]
MEIKELEKVNAELQEKKEAVDNVNFKMIKFSLAGKDFGVDIMNVKEIAKADKYTFVPNAASFVCGVYNLRGDIIPIIDLRLFFHLPALKAEDNLDNLLILHIEDRVYGTIVDKIDKVVGINTDQIQPPHPIFGDINIKFISGVVEKQGDLYIILDVVRIFSQSSNENENTSSQSPAVSQSAYYQNQIEAEPEAATISDSELTFVKDQLMALKKFYACPLNDEWVRNRFAEWSVTHSGDVQLKNQNDAEAFLEPFYSPYTNKFWSSDFAYGLKAILPDLTSNSIQVWNPGCGKGFETFSLACILKLRYPDGHIKIWANDSDIMAIANAPNMVFEMHDVPDYCQTFLSKGRNGYVFNNTIKDSIVFEYHDVTIENTLPELDIIVTRDLLSFLPEKGQAKLLSDIDEKLRKSKSMLILGSSEKMVGGAWKSVGGDKISAFVRAE